MHIDADALLAGLVVTQTFQVTPSLWDVLVGLYPLDTRRFGRHHFAPFYLVTRRMAVYLLDSALGDARIRD